MTTVADGLFQYGGSPVGPGQMNVSKLFTVATGVEKKGRAWFVDASVGTSGNGRSPAGAFSTMQQAFNSLASGDIIYAVGNITEQLVTPVNIFDVTVVGCGNRPRNADAVPAGGNWYATTWKAPADGVAAQATVRVLQQGWRFANILFNMLDVNAAGIEIVRNAGAGELERDASHADIVGCIFAGAGVGIRLTATSFTENPYNVHIAGNKFTANTFGISAVAASPNSCDIDGNWFQGCTNAIAAKLQASVIRRNVIQGFTAAANSGGIDIRSGGGNNQVTLNTLGGTYSKAGGYNCEAGDEWYGNFGSGGVTSSDPA